MDRFFTFEVEVEDEKKMIRRVRASNYQVLRNEVSVGHSIHMQLLHSFCVVIVYIPLNLVRLQPPSFCSFTQGSCRMKRNALMTSCVFR